jgi:Mannosyltransferase OCH1 and related enzymes
MMARRIYYCWFGATPLPEIVKTYIETWRKKMPDYEIFEINETNFDVKQYLYAKTAYEAGRYAFVSDCARIHFLQKTGGIYLDTDVELRKSLDSLIEDTPFPIIMSMEYFQFELTGVSTAVIISNSQQKIWQDLLEIYQETAFDNKHEPTTINKYITLLLVQNSPFKYRDIAQNCNYKADGMIAIVKSTLLMRDNKNAYAIHHLMGTWKNQLTFSRKIRRILGIILKKLIGRSNFEKIWK